MVAICGIIGYSSKDKIIPNNKLRMMYVLAQNRGTDGTGIALQNKVYKSKEDARHFVANTNFSKIREFIGHTRGKSFGAGKASQKNAHPFEINGLRGVHNGYINNHYPLANELNVDIDVDSEVAYHLISKMGLKSSLLKMRGRMVLVWYDENNVINIYRSNNPLYVGRKDGEVYWGSEKHYLSIMECEDIAAFKENTHYQITDGEVSIVEELDKKYQPPTTTKTYTRRGTNKTNNTKTGKDWKNKKVNTEQILQPDQAPEYAEMLCINGKYYYYWSESHNNGTKICVEELNGYGYSSVTNYYVTGPSQNKEALKTDYPEIYEQMRVDEK